MVRLAMLSSMLLALGALMFQELVVEPQATEFGFECGRLSAALESGRRPHVPDGCARLISGHGGEHDLRVDPIPNFVDSEPAPSTTLIMYRIDQCAC